MADLVDEKQIRAEQIIDIIMQKLAETGEKDYLKDVLRDRLINSGNISHCLRDRRTSLLTA